MKCIISVSSVVKDHSLIWYVPHLPLLTTSLWKWTKNKRHYSLTLWGASIFYASHEGFRSFRTEKLAEVDWFTTSFWCKNESMHPHKLWVNFNSCSYWFPYGWRCKYFTINHCKRPFAKNKVEGTSFSFQWRLPAHWWYYLLILNSLDKH